MFNRHDSNSRLWEWCIAFNLVCALVLMLAHGAWGLTSDQIRALNNNMGPYAKLAKLGSVLDALWDGRQSGGALSVTDGNAATFDVAAGIYMVQGVHVAGGSASRVALTGINTSAGHYRKVAICIDRTGTYSSVAGTATTAQATAQKPSCTAVTTEVAYLELPASFTGGTTGLTSDMLKQAATKAELLVPTPD